MPHAIEEDNKLTFENERRSQSRMERTLSVFS